MDFEQATRNSSDRMNRFFIGWNFGYWMRDNVGEGWFIAGPLPRPLSTSGEGRRTQRAGERQAMVKEFSSPPAPLHKWRGETSVASRREARDGERIFLSASGEEDKQMKENSHSITVGVTRMRHSRKGILSRKHFV